MNPLRWLCGIFGRHRVGSEEPPAPSPQRVVDATFNPLAQMTPDQVRRLLAHAKDGKLTEAEMRRAASRIAARHQR